MTPAELSKQIKDLFKYTGLTVLHTIHPGQYLANVMANLEGNILLMKNTATGNYITEDDIYWYESLLKVHADLLKAAKAKAHGEIMEKQIMEHLKEQGIVYAKEL